MVPRWFYYSSCLAELHHVFLQKCSRWVLTDGGACSRHAAQPLQGAHTSSRIPEQFWKLFEKAAQHMPTRRQMWHNICFTFIVLFLSSWQTKIVIDDFGDFLPTRCCREVYILLGPCVSCVQVWVSSVTEITPDDLRVQDMDSPPEDLRYMVTPPSNGHLALKSAPMQAVYNFTQKYIDQGQLLFVHKGKICF